MDPITHVLTGYVLSNAVYNESLDQKKISRVTFTLATVMAAVSPDIDSIAGFIGGDKLYFMNHRMITHSPGGLLILSLLCAFIIKIIKRDKSYKLLFFGAALGALSHILLDLTNVYSTLAAWPFSDKMYSLNLMSIVDVFVIGTYIVAILLCLIKYLRKYKRKIFTAVLIIIVCYIGAKFYIQQDLEKSVISEYEKGSFTATTDPLKLEKIVVMADYFDFDKWNFIIENSDSFIKGSVNFSSHKFSNTSYLAKQAMSIDTQKAANTPLGKFLLKFSQFIGYNTSKYKDGTLVKMTDLRYSNFYKTDGKKASGYSHLFGGYVVLDKDNNITYWDIRHPKD